MLTQFAQDLCTARRKAGLTPRDLSVLLGAGSAEIAALEAGERLPTVEQLCRLSIIYNRSFIDFYQHQMWQAREALFCHLPDLPECTQDDDAHCNRDTTLKRLEGALTAALTKRNAGA